MSLYRTGDPVLLSDPDAVWVRAFYLACNDNATDGLPHLTVAVDPTAKFGVATRWVADDRIRPDPDFALVRRDATPSPLGTLDACRKQVIADNAALEALAVQLEQDGHDAHAALARSLMRRWEGA